MKTTLLIILMLCPLLGHSEESTEIKNLKSAAKNTVQRVEKEASFKNSPVVKDLDSNLNRKKKSKKKIVKPAEESK